jgi:hypothetical protein
MLNHMIRGIDISVGVKSTGRFHLGNLNCGGQTCERICRKCRMNEPLDTKDIIFEAME